MIDIAPAIATEAIKSRQQLRVELNFRSKAKELGLLNDAIGLEFIIFYGTRRVGDREREAGFGRSESSGPDHFTRLLPEPGAEDTWDYNEWPLPCRNIFGFEDSRKPGTSGFQDSATGKGRHQDDYQGITEKRNSLHIHGSMVAEVQQSKTRDIVSINLKTYVCSYHVWL